jgi:hypothetical protein
MAQGKLKKEPARGASSKARIRAESNARKSTACSCRTMGMSGLFLQAPFPDAVRESGDADSQP